MMQATKLPVPGTAFSPPKKKKKECRLQRLPEYHWQLMRVRQPGSHAEVVGRVDKLSLNLPDSIW